MRVRGRGDRDCVGCCARRANRAEPEVVAVVPRRDHGDDAGRSGVMHGLDERIVRRIDLRPSAGKVDHVHAVLYRGFERCDDLGRVRDVAERRWHCEHAVVAEPRARRDSAQACDGRMVCTRRRGGPRDACGDAGDVCSVERRFGVDGEAARLAGARAGKDARDDHLRRRRGRDAAREAGGIRVACRIEEGVGLVDAVVDDRDLDAGAVGACRALQNVGTDHRRRLIKCECVGEAWIDLRHRRQTHECRQPHGRQRHRQRVEHDLEATADAGLRDRRADLGCCACLLLVEAAQVCARRRRVEIELAPCDRGQKAALAARRERRQREIDDDTQTSSSTGECRHRAHGDARSRVRYRHKTRRSRRDAHERRA